MAGQHRSEAERMAYEINRDGYLDAVDAAHAPSTYSPLSAETRQAVALERIAEAVEAIARGLRADLVSRDVIEGRPL